MVASRNGHERPGPRSEEIPSIEINQLGHDRQFNAAVSRTAIGLAVNLPQYRYNDTYQFQDNLTFLRGQSRVQDGRRCSPPVREELLPPNDARPPGLCDAERLRQ